MSDSVRLIPTLSRPEREYVIGVAIRQPMFFEQCRSLLTAQQVAGFVGQDADLGVLWQAALATADKLGGKLPEKDEACRLAIETEIRAATLRNGAFGPAPDKLFGLNGHEGTIDFIFSLSDEKISSELAVYFLRQYLGDNYFDALREDVISWKKNRPHDPVRFATELLQRAQVIKSIGADATCVPFLQDPIVHRAKLFTTSVSFLDKLMGGGQARGEVYVLLGPTGGGKTTLGMQIAAQGSLYEQTIAGTADRPEGLGHWFYFQYERPVDEEFRPRLYAHAAQIDYGTFLRGEKLSSWDTGDYKDYELERWSAEFASGLKVAGEKERYEAAYKLYGNKNLWPKDYSGHFEGKGSGGIGEIAADLDREVRQGRTPVGIVVDYAGLCVERAVLSGLVKSDEEYLALKRFVNEIRVNVAERFRCCVWVLHQLHGSETSKSPTAKMHHSRALGCRNFGDNASFAFELGNLDDKTGCLILHKSKSRRADPTINQSLVRLRGQFLTMEHADDEFAVNPLTHQIVEREHLSAGHMNRSTNRRQTLMDRLRRQHNETED